MDMLAEQHYAIKFCVHLKKNTMETILLLQDVFGNEILGILMIKRWHKMFLDGRELVEFELWGGKPKNVCTVTNISTVANAIKDKCYQSERALTTELKISRESTH